MGASLTYDVLIVGAGASGLAAAQTFLDAGVTNILVVEAQDYVGGRIKTWNDWGTPIELGAEFIHGHHTVTWQYVDELKLPVNLAEGEVRLVDQTGANITPQQRQQFDALMNDVETDGQSGVSLAERIAASQADDVVKQLAAVAVGDYEAGDADQLDSAAFAEMCRRTASNGNNYMLGSVGYQPIIERLKQNVPIKLQAIVKSIDFTSDYHVAVTFADSQILRAKKCIVTVSIGVLQHGDIAFTPALPNDVQTSINKIGMGNVMKCIVRFKDSATARMFQFADGESATLQTITNWWASAADPYVLVGYCGGSRAATALAMSPDELLTKVTADLNAIAGRDLKNDIADYHIARWDDNPYTRGGYSNNPVGVSIDDRAPLLQPVAGRLFFAGEAADTDGNYATVHGAIQSGRRAAKLALK